MAVVKANGTEIAVNDTLQEVLVPANKYTALVLGRFIIQASGTAGKDQNKTVYLRALTLEAA